MAAIVNATNQFKNIFNSSGYLLIMPSLVQVSPYFFISYTDHHIFYLLYRYQSPHFSLNLIQFQFQMLVCKSDLIKAINESDTLFADLKFQQWLFCRSNIPTVRTLFLDLQQQPLQPARLLQHWVPGEAAVYSPQVIPNGDSQCIMLMIMTLEILLCDIFQCSVVHIC